MNQIAYPLTQISRLSTQQIEKVTYYCQLLPPPTDTKNSKQHQIFSWLRQLTKLQLEQVLTFTSFFRVHMFLKLFKISQITKFEFLELNRSPFIIDIRQECNQYYYVRECSRDIKDYPKWISAQQFIIDHTFVSDYEWLFDTITLKGDINEIIEAFQIITKNEIFTKEGTIEDNQDYNYYEFNFKQAKPPCTIADLIVYEMEKAIRLKFEIFEKKCRFTKEPILFNYDQVKLNFESCEQNYQEFSQCFQAPEANLNYLSEKLILQSWKKDIKSENIQIHQIQQQISQFTQNIDIIFQTPIKHTLNEALLFCKFIVNQQLQQQYPLQKEKGDRDDDDEPKKRKYEKLKSIKKDKDKQQTIQDKQLIKVNSVFSSAEKSKILPENQQRLFSTKQEEYDQQLQEVSTKFIKRIFDNVIQELENVKQFKKKLKKGKSIKKKENKEITSNIINTSNVINISEIQQLNTTQEYDILNDFDQIDKVKSKKARKKQLEKQRKKETIEKKKNKLMQQNQSLQNSTQMLQDKVESSKSLSKNDPDEIQKVIEDFETKETNPEVFIATTTTSAPDDESEYVEVLNKKKNKQFNKQKQNSGKKNKQQLNNKEKEFKDDQSLPDEYQYLPPLKKGTSQSVQKNNYQYDEIKAEKSQSHQQVRNKLQKKEPVQHQNARLGLVKSIAQNKEQKIYTYDLDKSLIQKIHRAILEQKLSNDILLIYKIEQDQFNKYKQAREIAILRVKHIIKSLYLQFRVETQIFGSSKTGLALSYSDVDMVVLGVPASTKQQLYQPMSKLIEALQMMKWTISCKHIFQASIPVIKVLIDPSIDFLQFNGTQQYFILNHRNLNINEFNLRNGAAAQQIQIDITFELTPQFMQYSPYPYQQQQWDGHIGLKSTDFIIELCRSNNCFSEVAIVLKKLLRNKELNDSYTGGISSFCLTIMIAAIGHDLNAGSKLINFLHKYGCNFDPNKWAIMLDQDGKDSFINIEDDQTTQPLTIYSPINLQKIPINVTKIQQILQLFQQLYVELMQNTDQIGPSLQKKLNQTELLEIYNNNNIQKLVDIVNWQSTNLLDSYLN